MIHLDAKNIFSPVKCPMLLFASSSATIHLVSHASCMMGAPYDVEEIHTNVDTVYTGKAAY